MCKPLCNITFLITECHAISAQKYIVSRNNHGLFEEYNSGANSSRKNRQTLLYLATKKRPEGLFLKRNCVKNATTAVVKLDWKEPF